jgi:hypothetical protein
LADLIRQVVQSLIGGQRSLCFKQFVTVS